MLAGEATLTKCFVSFFNWGLPSWERICFFIVDPFQKEPGVKGSKLQVIHIASLHKKGRKATKYIRNCETKKTLKVPLNMINTRIHRNCVACLAIFWFLLIYLTANDFDSFFYHYCTTSLSYTVYKKIVKST